MIGHTFTMPTPATSQGPDVLQALLVGLAHGYNPLFAVFAVVSIVIAAYLLLRTKSTVNMFMLLHMILALVTFAGSLIFIIALLPRAVSTRTSTIVRATHPSLPIFAGFGTLYKRLKPKRVLGVFLVLLLLGSTQAANFANALQKSLSR